MHFPNAKWHVTDSQYSNEMLRRFVRMELKGKPVIAKRGKEDFMLISYSGATETLRCLKKKEGL